MHKKNIIVISTFLLILVFFCVSYYHELLFHMPYGIHTWAQADRLSLAINFYDNGMNFFKPATNSLYAEQGITGVEFPIQAYMAAIVGKIFGRQYIYISFRLLSVIISCTGLLFLFLASYRATKDFIISLVTPLFVFCSPVFIYYTCNYLPDAAAASVAFIAFYYILRYADSLSARHFIWSIVFLTLATLMKTSVGLYLCGFLLWVAYTRAKQWQVKTHLSFYIPTLISVSIIVGYYLYNRHLNTTYHSGVFLATINPFRSIGDIHRYIIDFRKIWANEYLVPAQYLLLAVVLVGAIPILFQNKHGKSMLLLILIFFTGMLAMTLLMGIQLFHHDYYAVSIFLPFVAFTLLVCIIAIHNAITNPIIILSVRAVSFAGLVLCFCMAAYHTQYRLQYGVAGGTPGISWAEGGAEVLRQLQIPKDEPIIVVNEDDANTHLLFFDRKGINIDKKQWSKVSSVSELRPQMWEYGSHTLVCQSGLANSLIANDTSLHTYFNTLYLDGRIAIFWRK